MKLAPGSVPWLLRHELRLAWRGSGGAKRLSILALLGGAYAGYHAWQASRPYEWSGTVEARSAGRNKGSEFIVTLPLLGAAPVG